MTLMLFLLLWCLPRDQAFHIYVGEGNSSTSSTAATSTTAGLATAEQGAAAVVGFSVRIVVAIARATAKSKWYKFCAVKSKPWLLGRSLQPQQRNAAGAHPRLAAAASDAASLPQLGQRTTAQATAAVAA